MYTIGTFLPPGKTTQERLDAWVANKEEIEKHPSPIAMELGELIPRLRTSLDVRREMTDKMDR